MPPHYDETLTQRPAGEQSTVVDGALRSPVPFDELVFAERDVKTMNGHLASGFQYVGRLA